MENGSIILTLIFFSVNLINPKINLKWVDTMSEKISDIVNEEMPKYLKAEHLQVTASIFDLNLEQLIYEKMFLLFEKVTVLNNKISTAEVELQVTKDKMLLETDFAKELDEKRPTIAMKEAYMKPFLADIENKIDELKSEYDFYKTKIIILNDLIKTRRMELKIENALMEE